MSIGENLKKAHQLHAKLQAVLEDEALTPEEFQSSAGDYEIYFSAIQALKNTPSEVAIHSKMETDKISKEEAIQFLQAEKKKYASEIKTAIANEAELGKRLADKMNELTRIAEIENESSSEEEESDEDEDEEEEEEEEESYEAPSSSDEPESSSGEESDEEEEDEEEEESEDEGLDPEEVREQMNLIEAYLLEKFNYGVLDGLAQKPPQNAALIMDRFLDSVKKMLSRQIEDEEKLKALMDRLKGSVKNDNKRMDAFLKKDDIQTELDGIHTLAQLQDKILPTGFISILDEPYHLSFLKEIETAEEGYSDDSEGEESDVDEEDEEIYEDEVDLDQSFQSFVINSIKEMVNEASIAKPPLNSSQIKKRLSAKINERLHNFVAEGKITQDVVERLNTLIIEDNKLDKFFSNPLESLQKASDELQRYVDLQVEVFDQALYSEINTIGNRITPKKVKKPTYKVKDTLSQATRSEPGLDAQTVVQFKPTHTPAEVNQETRKSRGDEWLLHTFDGALKTRDGLPTRANKTRFSFGFEGPLHPLAEKIKELGELGTLADSLQSTVSATRQEKILLLNTLRNDFKVDLPKLADLASINDHAMIKLLNELDNAKSIPEIQAALKKLESFKKILEDINKTTLNTETQFKYTDALRKNIRNRERELGEQFQLLQGVEAIKLPALLETFRILSELTVEQYAQLGINVKGEHKKLSALFKTFALQKGDVTQDPPLYSYYFTFDLARIEPSLQKIISDPIFNRFTDTLARQIYADLTKQRQANVIALASTRQHFITKRETLNTSPTLKQAEAFDPIFTPFEVEELSQNAINEVMKRFDEELTQKEILNKSRELRHKEQLERYQHTVSEAESAKVLRQQISTVMAQGVGLRLTEVQLALATKAQPTDTQIVIQTRQENPEVQREARKALSTLEEIKALSQKILRQINKFESDEQESDFDELHELYEELSAQLPHLNRYKTSLNPKIRTMAEELLNINADITSRLTPIYARQEVLSDEESSEEEDEEEEETCLEDILIALEAAREDALEQEERHEAFINSFISNTIEVLRKRLENYIQSLEQFESDEAIRVAIDKLTDDSEKEASFILFELIKYIVALTKQCDRKKLDAYLTNENPVHSLSTIEDIFPRLDEAGKEMAGDLYDRLHSLLDIIEPEVLKRHEEHVKETEEEEEEEEVALKDPEESAELNQEYQLKQLLKEQVKTPQKSFSDSSERQAKSPLAAMIRMSATSPRAPLKQVKPQVKDPEFQYQATDSDIVTQNLELAIKLNMPFVLSEFAKRSYFLKTWATKRPASFVEQCNVSSLPFLGTVSDVDQAIAYRHQGFNVALTQEGLDKLTLDQREHYNLSQVTGSLNLALIQGGYAKTLPAKLKSKKLVAEVIASLQSGTLPVFSNDQQAKEAYDAFNGAAIEGFKLTTKDIPGSDDPLFIQQRVEAAIFSRMALAQHLGLINITEIQAAMQSYKAEIISKRSENTQRKREIEKGSGSPAEKKEMILALSKEIRAWYSEHERTFLEKMPFDASVLAILYNVDDLQARIAPFLSPLEASRPSLGKQESVSLSPPKASQTTRPRDVAKSPARASVTREPTQTHAAQIKEEIQKMQKDLFEANTDQQKQDVLSNILKEILVINHNVTKEKPYFRDLIISLKHHINGIEEHLKEIDGQIKRGEPKAYIKHLKFTKLNRMFKQLTKDLNTAKRSFNPDLPDERRHESSERFYAGLPKTLGNSSADLIKALREKYPKKNATLEIAAIPDSRLDYLAAKFGKPLSRGGESRPPAVTTAAPKARASSKKKSQSHKTTSTRGEKVSPSQEAGEKTRKGKSKTNKGKRNKK